MVRKNSLSYFILLALEKAVEGGVRLEDFLYNPGYYAYGSGWQYPLKKANLVQALKRLRERGLIETNILDIDTLVLKLTMLGKDSLGSNFEEQEWDGKWRVVIFDIPEEKRRIRDLFRRKLKRWGFKNWQQSVWVTKNNMTKKLRNSIEELGLEDWVAVLESDNISSNNNLFNGR